MYRVSHQFNLLAEEFYNLVLVEYQARLYKTFIHWYIHRLMPMVYFRKLHAEVHDLHNATTFGSHR
jgi:hypothetical protein